MAKVAIEQIEAVRSGERNTYFSGLKGFVLSMVKEGIPSILIGAAAGAVVAGAALLGAEGAQLLGWISESTTFTGSAGALGFTALVSAASGALSGALVGVRGAYQEINHARTVNSLINQEINNIKGRAQGRAQNVEIATEAPVTPDYVKKILDAGEQVHPKTQLAKLMQQREEAALSQGEIKLH